MLKKAYQQSFWGKSILFAGLILGIDVVFESYIKDQTFWFWFSTIGLPLMVYAFLAAGVFLKIIVSEQGVKVEAGKLMRPRELKWEEIGWVVDDSWLGIHIYHLIPKSYEKRISIPWSIKDHRDLLTQVIQRSPQAEVEESVKRLVEKHNKA